MESDIELLLDSKEIELNIFVSKILSGTIEGAISSLHGIDKDWKKLEIKINRK